jgi:hypothetical protein
LEWNCSRNLCLSGLENKQSELRPEGAFGVRQLAAALAVYAFRISGSPF